MATDVKAEMETIKAAMEADPDFAWSWHCNVSMAAYDQGPHHTLSNRAAAGFMRLAFGIDTSKNPNYPEGAKPGICGCRNQIHNDGSASGEPEG